MTIKIKMELTEDEAEAVIRHHCEQLHSGHAGVATAARIHDISKRVQRAYDNQPKEPETQQAPIAAAWPNS